MTTDVDSLSFRRKFEKAYANLKLPPDCVEQQPPTFANSRLFSWTFDWLLIFKSDNKYLRVRESHEKVAGLLMSRRLGFAFHYGPISEQDANVGIPGQGGRDSEIGPVSIPKLIRARFRDEAGQGFRF